MRIDREKIMSALYLLPLALLATNAGAQMSEKPEEYRYAGATKRDPFKPIAIAAPSMQTLGQLQDFSLKELHLVGTLLGTEMSALIMTPKNEGIIVRIGDKVGRAGGRVILIANNHIVVREPVNEQENSGTTAKGPRKKFNDITVPIFKKKSAVDLSSKFDSTKTESTLQMEGFGTPDNGLPTNPPPNLNRPTTTPNTIEQRTP